MPFRGICAAVDYRHWIRPIKMVNSVHSHQLLEAAKAYWKARKSDLVGLKSSYGLSPDWPLQPIVTDQNAVWPSFPTACTF
jgi:hypothetical protein